MKAVLIVPLILAVVHGTPLDDYVNRPDPTYKYELINKVKGPDYTLYNINMTSQTWMPDWQSNPVWHHTLSVTIPDKILYPDVGFLFIEGGGNPNGLPSPNDKFVDMTTMIALGTGTITGNLKQVPNQPTVFKDDPGQDQRTEDAIIAWTWKTFLDNNGSNPEVLLRMPMTKASVRALDTMDDFAQKTVGNKLTRFVAAGESKRGWTTWMVGAVDKRMIAICPIVMDLLNFQQNLHHFYRSLGGWTFEFNDYYSLNFTGQLDNPVIKKMAAVIDPLSYTDRYANLPKYIISATGDEFFMIDDSRFYYDQLKGPTYFRQIPNAEHELYGHRVSLTFSLRAFYLSVLTRTPLPEMSWKKEFTSTGGRITLTTEEDVVDPVTIIGYHATTLDDKRKDFRLVVGSGDPDKPSLHPVMWFTKEVVSMGNKSYSIEFDNPSVGWTGFFIQVSFPGPNGTALEFTTETLVIPDTYPFPDCRGATCRGVLV